MELIRLVTQVALLAFVVSSMLAMGLSVTIGQVAAPLGNVPLVVRSLFANFVVMPLGALALGWLLRLDGPLFVGLLLLGSAAGAPFLPKLAEIGKADLPFAIGLMVLLMVVTVAYMPIVLPFALPGVSVDPLAIARSLVLLMLLPLSVALAFAARFTKVAARLKAAMVKLSSASLVVFIALVSAANVRNVVELFGTRGIFAGTLFSGIGVAAGWLLGGRDVVARRTLALGTAQRNIAAAVVVGSQSDPNAVVMIVVVALVGFVILMPLARAFGHRPAAPSPA